MMTLRSLRLISLAVAMMAAPALAQSPQCDGWRAEVARIDRAGASAGDAGAGQQARRVSAELNRTIARYRGLGCEQAGGFFGPAPHPQCGPTRQRMAELQGAYASLDRRAQGGVDPGLARRRGELVAAINAYCRQGVYQTPQPVAAPQQTRPRGFFEALFGLPEQRYEPEVPMPDPLFDDQPKTPVWGSGRPVCVRLCDGFFFPLHSAASGREGADDMCQALCPASETRVFYMGGNGDIESAAGRNGPYTSLANASRYTRSFDPACGCRKPGQSWASALAEAEDMLDRRKGDMIVSAAKAEELSKPRETRETRRAQERAAEQRKKLEAQQAAATSTEARVNAVIANPEAAAMVAATEGKESAGIGPQNIPTTGTVSAAQGQTLTVTNADGEQRKVRIVAPTLTPQTGDNRPDGPLTVRR